MDFRFMLLFSKIGKNYFFNFLFALNADAEYA
ncbi:hypothetical protein T12_13481 [Trichinella patagoniensis]|uniref:Uncharacterized protein n=1 Tax=Trichinella patagoniensis TaxID=990121 RepID=A0A0V0XJL4_9BILA|nr:hypothetical protein T12_13481 [Trichinella patagoniensis]